MEFRPRVLRDVTVVDTTTTLLGRPSALPLALAPTGFTRMMHHQGERAVVRVAEGAGIPYALSTLGTTSIEDMAAAAPTARKWFQLYVWRDRGAGKELVERAQAAGYEALILTVDMPVAGARLRDVRNGLTIPLADPGDRPGRRHPPLVVVQPAHHRSPGVRLPDLLGGHGRRADQPDVRPRPDPAGPVVAAGELVGAADVKGIQHVDDARMVVDHGADAVVSDHGGRQLDRAPTPLEVLPTVVDAVGDGAEVLVDGGVRSGADVVAAVALGAKACLVGRAYLYGLMAGGERGVQRAIDILTSEITRTMQLLGTDSVSRLEPAHVRLRP